jgi:pyruvate dehydrogenase E1 component alpha subunit
VGVVRACPPDTVFCGQLRNHGLYLTVTRELRRFFAELYGKLPGTGGGKAGSMHLCAPEQGLMTTAGIVAATIAPAVGAALAATQQGRDNISAVLFGDAAMEEGEFYERLNLACLRRLPVIFLCEDNELSIHVSTEERRGFRSPFELARSFKCYAAEGNGADVLEVMDITTMAIRAMRHQERPAFLCLHWFRYLEHVGPGTDFHVGYRPRPSDEELDRLDPIKNYERYLAGTDIPTAELERIRAELAVEIEANIAAAKNDPVPTAEDLMRGVYA